MLIRKDFKTGEKRKVVIDGKEVVVAYLGAGNFVAFSARCTHLGCDLEEVGVIVGEEVVCQCHYSRFSLKDGRVTRGPAKEGLEVFDVKDLGEYIEVRRRGT